MQCFCRHTSILNETNRAYLRMYKKPPAKFNFAGGLLIRTYQADLEHIMNLLNPNAF